MAVTRTYFSETLIIRALNKPGGSGGVYRWIEGVRKDTLRRAVRIAPVGDPMDYNHRAQRPGTYKASFRSDGRGSNGHWLRRTVYNIAPHAGIVEKGRRSTKFQAPAVHHAIVAAGGLPRGWERFSWSVAGGAIVKMPGTSGRDGQHTLEHAFAWAIAKRARTLGTGLVR